MSQRFISLALVLSFFTGGLCALPVEMNCPMLMGSSAGCADMETATVGVPCCCEIDRDATPASSSSPATVAAAIFEFTPSATASAAAPADQGMSAPLAQDRPLDKPLDLLSLHSVLRI